MYYFNGYQVELALSVEELLPNRLRRYFIREQVVVVPNRKLNIIEKLRFNVFGTESSRFDSEENISNALHPQPVSTTICHSIYQLHVCMSRYRSKILGGGLVVNTLFHQTWQFDKMPLQLSTQIKKSSSIDAQ